MPAVARGLLGIPSTATLRVGFAECGCGWTVTRPTFEEAALAAAVHDLLRHTVRPPPTRPTW
jgi:hypothetical protein